MLLCQKPLLFASERPESENNKFTKLLTQSEIETHVQHSIVPSLLLCEAGHIYLHSLSKRWSVYYLWSRWIVFAMKWETNVMKRVVYISGQEIVVYINISTVVVMWKTPREMCWRSGSNKSTSFIRWKIIPVFGQWNTILLGLSPKLEKELSDSWCEDFRQKEIRTQMGKRLRACIEPLDLVTCSQHIIPFRPIMNWFNPVQHIAVFYINFDIIFTFTIWSPRWSLLLRCSNHNFV